MRWVIMTMIAATPLSEWLAKRFGHRIACLVGAACLGGSLAGLAWGVSHGYLVIAACMVVMTIGLRTVMTICAIALVGAMPENRTSMGTALNDTAQEVGTSVGTAVIGTMIALLVTTQLPVGTWSHALVQSFFHGERIAYAREMLTGRQPARDDVPCTTCEIYLKMRRRGRWLERNPV